MNKQDICEALYALPTGRVVARRQTIIKPLIISLLGLVLLFIDWFAIEQRGEALSLTLILVGITLLIYGAVRIIAIPLNKECVPYDNKRGCYLLYRERYYDRTLLPALQRAVDIGDLRALEDMPTTNISAVVLSEYRSRDGSLIAYGIYEYVEEDYRAVGKPKIIEE